MNLARFFAFLAANLKLLAEELELDLSSVHEIELSPLAGDLNWWCIDIDKDMYVFMEAHFGEPSIVLNGHHGDWVN